jgi:L-histidine N-alpha-methyltransferase
MSEDPVVAAEALAGLLAPRKTLPAKLFYDEEGCRLFYRITELPEYYLTRTERTLLPAVADYVSGLSSKRITLVEYGASDEEKARYLLRASPDAFDRYIPVDVAEPALRAMAVRLRTTFPALPVQPVVADFLADFALPPLPPGPRLGFFPGSTIGNLEPAAATAFMARARRQLGGEAWFLLGADLRKSPTALIPAYDDAAGVTAAFNRNLLVRLNREAGADFDPSAFEHRAVWNDPESRIEMHLVSERDQTVQVAGHRIAFRAGETIHTENSYKYTLDRIERIAGDAEWRLAKIWTDPAGLFATCLFETA